MGYALACPILPGACVKAVLICRVPHCGETGLPPPCIEQNGTRIDQRLIPGDNVVVPVVANYFAVAVVVVVATVVVVLVVADNIAVVVVGAIVFVCYHRNPGVGPDG